jgi:hypothetical protein
MKGIEICLCEKDEETKLSNLLELKIQGLRGLHRKSAGLDMVAEIGRSECLRAV